MRRLELAFVSALLVEHHRPSSPQAIDRVKCELDIGVNDRQRRAQLV